MVLVRLTATGVAALASPLKIRLQVPSEWPPGPAARAGISEPERLPVSSDFSLRSDSANAAQARWLGPDPGRQVWSTGWSAVLPVGS